ncbi:hypothetical protein V9L05_08245 [Bernardetia sp. Wsw4-3y2]|uniref:hypothetical protein n=1 Tax=Bernardetia sp. Wsw4-3y2 TaxID=3127471 RepID=UPI0030CC2A07
MKADQLLETNFLEKWKGLKTLVRIEYEHIEKNITICKTRYYISSKINTAAYFNQ